MSTRRLLWTPEDLVSSRQDPRLKLIDVRTGEHFALGHIPGAHHFGLYGLNTYDTDDAPLRSFVRMWAFLLGRCGVSARDRVVLYEDDSGMTAARGFWFLEYLGHKDVHILDGGLRAWRESGFEVTRETETPTPVVYEYVEERQRLATYHDVLAAVDDSTKLIWDTREDGEWFGTDRRAKRGGTIPGSIHLEWTALRSDDGRFLTRGPLEALLASRGITKDRDVHAFCNTGYRSAHAYVALRLLDYPRVRNYVGSWQEWGNREELPIVTPLDNERAQIE